jgi:hypothetical protein
VSECGGCGHPDCVDCNPPSAAGQASADAAVAAYRLKVLNWLRHKERKWRRTAQQVDGAAGEAASFYAAAYFNAADGIASGDPERWQP